MIRATEADRDEIEGFLQPVAQFAMFPLNNLAHHGMAGGHPFAMQMWLARRDGAVCDVLARTEAGMVMPVLPSGDYHTAAAVLAGTEVAGIIGVRDWARGLEAALPLTGARALNADEPQFLLDLAELVVPDGPGQIVPLDQVPTAVIKGWMLDYQLATLHTPVDLAPQRLDESYRHYVARGSHVVLMEGDAPLAMTGFNAHLPDIVQIGGVYTPPDLRGRGHARRAVALHLAAARGHGVRQAVLFSASDMAARAYRALGFRQIGLWTLMLMTEKEMLP